MKQVALFMCGAPVTGKTTSTNMLADYFKGIGISAQVITKPARANYTQAIEYIGLALYKWYNEETAEVVIVDGPGLTVFDRKEIMKVFGDQSTATAVPIIAIWHSRSHLFMYEHNKDAGHDRISERTILNQANLDQQPIRAEGFSSVYHVGGKSKLNLAAVIKAINENCKTEYPVPVAEKYPDTEDAPTDPAPAAESIDIVFSTDGPELTTSDGPELLTPKD